MDHFYITLPSNSSEQFYGRQSMSNYKTRLSKSIDLDVDEWEVGLAEIIYPHTWKNINDGKYSVKLLDGNDWVWKEAEIPQALYDNPLQLVDCINKATDDVMGKTQENKIHLWYNELTRKITVGVTSGYMIEFPLSIASALGFGDTAVILKNSYNTELHGFSIDEKKNAVYDYSKITGPYVLDLNRGLHTFFIYCNIVEYQLVGDSNVPLLRTVAVSGKNGEVVAKSFDNIHYVGLGRSTFQDIELHITDDTGLRVPFEQGRIIVKLHFRRK